MTDEPAVRPSALADALARVGDRWSLLVVAALEQGPRRFGDLARDLDGVAPNVLTSRLRALEREALVVARPYSHRPLRFVYELAQSGQELARALHPLAEWATRRGGEGLDPPRGVRDTA